MMKQFPTRGRPSLVRDGVKPTLRKESEVRKPIYNIYIADISGSMLDTIEYTDEEGVKHTSRKIDELNAGLNASLDSMRAFEKKRMDYRFRLQVVELSTYGKAIFEDGFVWLDEIERFDLVSHGATCLENSLSTLVKCLTEEKIHTNRKINIFLMSDGEPTDVNGEYIYEKGYKPMIDRFKAHLREHYRGHVDLYSIAVSGADENMLRYFADEGRFYRVGEADSLADWINFVTLQSFVSSSGSKLMLDPRTGVPRPAPGAPGLPPKGQSISRVMIDTTRMGECLGCYACLDQCPKGALRSFSSFVTIDDTLCDRCGICRSICPKGVIINATPEP